jgi:L-ascorbate metabolism protein UlaG (beta-lactamase superfamily)
MKFAVALSLFTIFAITAGPAAGKSFQVDRIPTSSGDLEITFVGHGTLMLGFGGKVIHVDPFGKLTDYNKMPDADLILITHEHRDHLDLEAIAAIRKSSTIIVANPAASSKIEGAIIMENGQRETVMDLPIQTVPAYNVVHKRDNGEPFHPPGRDNGYVIIFGDKRVYIAGDTENIEEMESLGPVDIAFIPANLPYTMTPEMAADAARKVSPQILYPYHYGDTVVTKISELLGDIPEIEVRVRSMK